MNEGEINKKEIIPLKLSEQDKRNLHKKVLRIFGNSTLNSENLGKYRNSELSTPEVVKRLQQLGLLEEVKNFQKKFASQAVDIQERGEEFERLARITLMLVDKFIANGSFK